MQRSLRIHLASPAENAWSETFIAAHIDRLEKVELLLTGGVPPRNASKGPQPAARGPWGRRMDRLISQFHGGMPGLLRHRLARRWERDRPDVVLAEYGTMGAEIWPACRDAEVPLVVHFHGFDAHRNDYVVRYGRYAELFAYASALVVVSRAMERRLIALGAPAEKVIYNCYGIDIGQFAAGDASKSPPHLLAVGRFAEKKAPQVTIRAFKMAIAQVPEARLTMVGKGVLWEECRRLVAELGLSGSVDLCGVKRPDEIVALMHASRAFVQHSVVTPTGDHEGTPLAVLESMAAQLPVVSTAHAGIADVVEHEVSGLLGAEHDVETMAANMVRLLRDPALAGAMGRAGRARVEGHHRVEVQVAGLQSILEKAAAR